MKLVDLTLTNFTNEIDSASPAPGGGSVSALISLLGTSLVKMVGHLTVHKKKFLKLDEAIQNQFNQTMSNLDIAKASLLDLIDQDTLAFNDIMKAYQLPKETSAQVEYRSLQIQIATKQAIVVPMQVVEISRKIFYHLSFVLTHCNIQAVSDMGVAILSIATGAEGAGLNVLINAQNLEDEQLKLEYSDKIKKILEEINHYKTSLMRMVYHIIEKD